MLIPPKRRDGQVRVPATRFVFQLWQPWLRKSYRTSIADNVTSYAEQIRAKLGLAMEAHAQGRALI